MKKLEGIEHEGALQLLLTLATAKEKQYVTSVIRRQHNPDGFITQSKLDECRRTFRELGLITEQLDEGPRPKKFLIITEKGRRVAEKIREILEILEE